MKYELRVTDAFGDSLEVLQELPSHGDKFPTILMVPGFGADLHEYGYFDEISTLLVRNGFQTFRFSFAGSGKSTGDFVDMTVDKQAQQIHDVMDYVKKDRFTNVRKIGILAQSFGGSTVIAALPLKSPKAYLFTGILAHPQEDLAKYFKRQRGYDPEGISKRERSDNRITKIGPQFWKNLETHDFVSEIKQIDKPVLLIHGTKDRIVKAAESLECFEALTAKKKLHIIERADHGYTGKYRLKVLQLVQEWFVEQLISK